MPCVSLFDQKITDRDAKHCVSIVRSKAHRLRRKALRLYIGFSNSNPNLKNRERLQYSKQIKLYKGNKCVT
ncbi:MAG: hypothetical protein LBB88_04870 [Planctomycetaceae bacterium]|nr:hypothetical protein [Planctomycetaceae bacterium]